MLLLSYEIYTTKQIPPGSTINHLVIFAGRALKLEKVGPIFSDFMSTFAIQSKRRQETVSRRKYSF